MSIIDELLISVGLDAQDFAQGIDNVRSKIAGFAGKAKESFEGVGEAATQSGAVSALSFDRSSERVAQLGEASKEAASAIENSFQSIGPVIEAIRSRVGMLAATFGLVAGGVETFQNYIEKSDALGNLSTQLGIDVKELDAFGKAAEAAGGSAESMFASMQAYYEQTGRPAEEVFQLASKVEGMSRGAAQRFLQAQGVATDAIPIFLQGQKALDDLMNKYRKTAFTAQDAKNARAFKVAWMDFRTSAQAVGNTLVRIVLPPLTKLIDFFSELVNFIGENTRAFALLGIGFAAVFAAKNISAIKEAIAAVKAFGVAVKMAALPVTAIVAGVVAFAVALDDLIGFATGADSMLERMLKSFGQTDEQIESLRNSLQAIGKAFGWLWDTVKPLLSGALSFVFKAMTVAILAVVAAVEYLLTFFQALWNTGKKMGKDIAEAIESAWQSIKDLAGEVANFGSSLADLFKGIPDAIIGALDAAWQFVVDWFDGWSDLIAKKVAEPIKGFFKGIGKFFNFGGDDESAESNPSNLRERETVVVKQAGYKAVSPTVTTNASMNVVNNIQTRDNPQAIGRAVESSVSGGFNRQAALIGQSMSGTNLK